MGDFENVAKTVSRSLTDVVIAYLLSIVTTGEGVVQVAKILLAIKLNVFALPFLGTELMPFPWWVVYIISVLWMAQILHYSPYEVGDIISTVEDQVARRWNRGVEDGPTETVAD